ncbi:MAG: tRNA (adenosine(37)-N6)-dimethylallyltransferase MiaA [Acholeplasmataceae bacterium]
MKKVIVIVGPTGSGKTGLSIDIAKRIDGEVINGDSVQIYRRLDIGSAKIKPADKKNIKHHLFDIKDPEDKYSVFDFQRDVRKTLKNITNPIICGGTGLYIKAALYDYEFAADERKTAFERAHEHFSVDTLYEMLLKKDPKTTVDKKNKRRVLRALEQTQSGVIPSSLNKKNKPLYDILILYLDIERDVLEKRLIDRLEHMLEEGFVAEVEALKKDDLIINAIGYRELYRYLDGEINLEEAKKDILTATKRFAKRQKTWFKNQETPIFLNALSPTLVKDAMAHVEAFLNKG